MTMSINQRMEDEGPPVHYDPSFFYEMESHIEYLRNHPDSDYLEVSDQRAHKHQADFYGLLKAYDVPFEQHWIVLRMNGLTSPTQYMPDMIQILLPSDRVIANIRQIYRTTYQQ